MYSELIQWARHQVEDTMLILEKLLLGPYLERTGLIIETLDTDFLIDGRRSTIGGLRLGD